MIQIQVMLLHSVFWHHGPSSKSAFNTKSSLHCLKGKVDFDPTYFYVVS